MAYNKPLILAVLFQSLQMQSPPMDVKDHVDQLFSGFLGSYGIDDKKCVKQQIDINSLNLQLEEKKKQIDNLFGQLSESK